MTSILPRLRSSSLRSMAASRIVGSSSANFFWSSPEVAKAPPPSEAPNKADDEVESLTSTDIVKHVAEAHSLSQAESRRVINTIFDSIKEVSLHWCWQKHDICFTVNNGSDGPCRS